MSVIVKNRFPYKGKASQCPQAFLIETQVAKAFNQMAFQFLTYRLVEIFQQCGSRFDHLVGNLRTQLLLQPIESLLYFLRRATLVIDLRDAFLEVHTVADAAQHLVAGTENSAEELELLIQQFIYTHIGSIAFVEEVDNYHVVLLPVAMAAANALLDALWVPGHIIVHHQRAELEVDALGCRLGGNHPLGAIVYCLKELSDTPGV